MLANQHVLIVGSSGSGKSTAEVRELVEEADQYNSAIICIDPHGVMAYDFFAHLCQRGHRERILYDRLCDINRVLAWDFLPPSTAASERERDGENDTRCREFADILLRRRGKSSMAGTPNIEEWVLAALNLYIHQRKRRPLADLRYAYQFAHPTFRKMLDGCGHDDTKSKFQLLIASRRVQHEAAEKLITKVCNSPAFQVRTERTGGFDFDGHLNRKGILIIEGGIGGTLSQDAMQTMMGAVIQKTFNFLRARKREFPQVTLSLDEANNANLIGDAGHEVRALAELRKYGLAMHILVQHLDFPGQITKGVMTNCATKRYFYSSDAETAARLGADLGTSYTTSGTKPRYYKDGSVFHAPAEFNNPFAEEIRNFEIGECYVRRQNKNTRERITPLPDPFGLPAAARNGVIEGLLTAVKKRSEYFCPDEKKSRTNMPPKPPAVEPSSDEPDDDSPLGIF